MKSMKQMKPNLPALRFPEFADAPAWIQQSIVELISTVTPYKKIQSNLYLSHGKYPIIDQGQNHISGWTNEEDCLVVDDFPLIVFGDHTCVLKLVKYPFAQGADGIKIIKPNSKINNEYLYHFLCFFPVKPEEYKRHFSILKTKTIAYPIDKTEQQKIADCLSSLDEVITAQGEKIENLRHYKKGLLQSLFPAEGETIPALRFPEFANAPAWETKRLGEVCTIAYGKDHRHIQKGDIPVFGSGGYMLSVAEYLYDGESICIGRKGTIDKPFFLTGKFWAVDTLFYTHTFIGCLPKFIYLIFQNIFWQNYNEASGVPSLSRSTIENISSLFPTLPEQQKIADCLSSLDEMIDQESQNLENLKRHKRGLMQGLFPVNDEVAS